MLMMKLQKAKSPNTKIARKRTKSDRIESPARHEIMNATVGIPGLFEPTEYDLRDELSRLDAFNMREYY